MTHARKPGPAHLALLLATVAIWGTNFVVIKIGLRDFDPMLFALLRFALCALPWIWFVPRPPVPWRALALFGVLLGPGQFGLLFYAMRSDITPGLASLIIQMQVFFTIALAMWLFHERLSTRAMCGMALGAAGLATIGLHLSAEVTIAGVLVVLGAALCWAGANIVVKRASRAATGPVDMLAFMIWSSVFAVPPLLVLALANPGLRPSLEAVAHARWDAWLALLWQVVGNMLFGYTIWNRMLARYDSSAVAPYALLVPVFGMGASALFLSEGLPPWKWAAAAMVITGIALITVRAASPTPGSAATPSRR